MVRGGNDKGRRLSSLNTAEPPKALSALHSLNHFSTAQGIKSLLKMLATFQRTDRWGGNTDDPTEILKLDICFLMRKY